jgi:hypothetical protein
VRSHRPRAGPASEMVSSPSSSTSWQRNTFMSDRFQCAYGKLATQRIHARQISVCMWQVGNGTHSCQTDISSAQWNTVVSWQNE